MKLQMHVVDRASEARLLAAMRDAAGRAGNDVMLKAIDGKPGATLLVAFDMDVQDEIVGASAFRVDHVWIKRINTGVVYQRRGIGTALVREIRRLHPGLAMWCLALPGAWAWNESMGAIRVADLPDGRRHFVLPAGVVL